MDHDVKKRLKSACSVPDPERKDHFLKEHRKRELSISDLYRIQLRYISPFVWSISACIVVLLLFIVVYANDNAVWLVSSFVPILSTIASSENHKSEIYQMNELELSARFSLRTIVMIRMSIFGIVHSLILVMISLLLNLNVLHSLVYLLVPYLITSNISSLILRHSHGRAALSICLVNSFIISMIGIFIGIKSDNLYSAVMFPYWTAILIPMMLFGMWNVKIFLRRTECFYGIGN